MVVLPSFKYFDALGHELDGQEFPKPAHKKLENTVSLLNRSGILMEGNGYLELTPTSYMIVTDDRKYQFLQILHTLPHVIINVHNNETVELHEYVNQSMMLLKKWVDSRYISKKLFGQFFLMMVAYPQLKREDFISVARKGLQLKDFMRALELGNGEYDDELAVAGLPSEMHELLEGLVNGTLED